MLRKGVKWTIVSLRFVNWITVTGCRSYWKTKIRISLHLCFTHELWLKVRGIMKGYKQAPIGCVPFGESKNGFLILDLSDFEVKRNVKSEIGFVTVVTFRQRVQYAWQPLKKWRVFYCLTNYAIIPCRILWSAVRITTMEDEQIKKEAR